MFYGWKNEKNRLRGGFGYRTFMFVIGGLPLLYLNHKEGNTSNKTKGDIIMNKKNVRPNIVLDFEKKTITVTKEFYKKAREYESPEYNSMMRVCREYADYALIVYSIKKKEDKESYRGLTYQYMEEYIRAHNNADTNMAIFNELKFQAKCHSIRFPVIKKWFLDTYPELVEFSKYLANERAKKEKELKFDNVAAVASEGIIPFSLAASTAS